jgi:hypothetical protein
MSKARLSGHFQSKELFCLSCCIPLFLASLLLLFPLTAQTVYAAQVRLGWHASPDPDVAGYKVYYGPASRTYSHAVDVGPATRCVIAGLADGKDYFFAAKAYNTSRVESNFSDEIAYCPSKAVRLLFKPSGPPDSNEGRTIGTAGASQSGTRPSKMMKGPKNGMQR